MRRFLCSLLIACSGTSNTAPSGDASTDTGSSTDTPATAAPIVRIDVLQGTSVTVWRDGSDVAMRNAPIIAGRSALVRVFVSSGMGAISARLKINGSELTGSATLTGPSTEDVLLSTLNFDVAATSMTETSELSILVDGTTIPVTTKLRAQPAQQLQLVLIPYKYTFDGSNRVPDTSEDAVRRLSDGLQALLPVSSITITVKPIIDIPVKLEAKGIGFNEWLDAVKAYRKADAPKGVIYGGIAVPGESLKTWCASGCVGSLAPTSVTLVPDNLVFVQTQFPDTAGARVEDLGFTLGLNLGRQQASCGGLPGPDTKYPHEGGKIGVVGYDASTKKLVAKSTMDIMTFCTPKWISDYTFAGAFSRLVEINKL
jgi:hypothetical protein